MTHAMRLQPSFDAGWVLLPPRVVLGLGFLVHGLAKWNRGPEKFAVLLTRIGVPLPLPAAWGTTLTEILGGTALLVGLYVSLACIPLMITMLVAMFTIHVHFGFSAVNTVGLTATGPLFGPPGYEINLLYISMLLALALAEPTVFSLDRLRRAPGS